MNYIRITKENIDKEHICCAMSGKQSVAKKEWLRQRFDDGLVFYRSEERGKCFIEYIPAENAWVPIEADGYLYIDCLWVSGSMKGHGYSNDLLEACIRDAKAQGKRGRKVFAFCARRAGSGNFLLTRNSLPTKGSVWQTYPTAGSISCTFPLNRLHRCRSSGNARSIRRLKITVLFCITPISVPTPIIGYQGCRRWRRNMVSRSRPSISLTKNLHRMYPHRSRPMPCSGTVSF